MSICSRASRMFIVVGILCVARDLFAHKRPAQFRASDIYPGNTTSPSFTASDPVTRWRRRNHTEAKLRACSGSARAKRYRGHLVPDSRRKARERRVAEPSDVRLTVQYNVELYAPNTFGRCFAGVSRERLSARLQAGVPRAFTHDGGETPAVGTHHPGREADDSSRHPSSINSSRGGLLPVWLG